MDLLDGVNAQVMEVLIIFRGSFQAVKNASTPIQFSPLLST
jgi:hypothetical protein